MKVNNTYIRTNNEGNNKQNLRNKQLKASPLETTTKTRAIHLLLKTN